MTSETLTHASGAALGKDVEPLPDLDVAAQQFVIAHDQVLLKGSMNPSTHTVYFPAREYSMEGGQKNLVPCTFGPQGRLYSYATIHVSSTRQTPYTIGYVDFPNGVRVLAQVRGNTAELECDCAVELRADADDWFVEKVQEVAQ